MSNREKDRIQTIAFYNIENLFDTEDDVNTDDNDFLPHAAKRWTKKRYENKLQKISVTITQIGDEDMHPILIGLAEVENKNVINDLISTKHLKPYPYNFVHYDSSDERGIDVALIYDNSCFNVVHSEPFSVYLEDDNGNRDYTRDILLVSGHLGNELVHIIVNHWSSRREGEDVTAFKRIAASEKVVTIIEDLRTHYEDPKIIVMGDFNDNPGDISIENLEQNAGLFNPFKTIRSREKGSLNHDFEWHLFDQILLSYNFLNTVESHLDFHKADVFNDKFLTQYHGKFKGQPFRTYVGKKYKGGYSDHFPVYIQLKS